MTLTPRQEEVLKLAAEGIRYNDVARKLGIEVSGVQKHLDNARQRLEVESFAHLVHYALAKGIVKNRFKNGAQ